MAVRPTRPLAAGLIRDLLVALLITPVCSVRLSQPTASLRRGEGGGGHCSEMPPGIHDFDEKWRAVARSHKFRIAHDPERLELLQSGGAASIRFVVGVFSRAGCQDAPYRDTIRRTWMQLPGVCILRNSSGSRPASKCAVYATFVVGNNGHPGTGEDDLTVLPMEENMNRGKSGAWFRYAATFEWATHVAKMDMDAFPYFYHVLSEIGSFRTACEHVYGGLPVSCDGQDPFCPPSGCGMPRDHDFLSYNIDNPGCYVFMQGGFYFLTRELAATVSARVEQSDFFKRCYPEDVTLAHTIRQYANEHKTCVAALTFGFDEAAFHHWALPFTRKDCW